MKTLRFSLLVAVVGLLAGSLMLAHPHIAKSVEVKTDSGAIIKVSFFTAPANMEHVKKAAVGSYNASFAQLSVSADVSAGDTTIPKGDYTVVAIRDSESSWTLGLQPGKIPYGESPDAAKVIKLHSSLSKDSGSSDHVTFDLTPGAGDMAGKLVLVWHFGSLHLSGALS